MLVAGGQDNSSDLANTTVFDVGAGATGRAPVLSGVTSPLSGGNALAATGSGFEPDLEASGGGTSASATNYPLVQVMRVDNGQTAWVTQDATTSFTGSSFTSTASSLSGFPEGPVLVTAYVNGIPSASQSALLYVPSAPYAPTNVVASGGTGQMTVSFSAPFDGDSPITGYTVSSVPADGTDTNAGSLATSHLVTGLQVGTAYTFTVTATNAIGTSGPSNPSAPANSSQGYVFIDGSSLSHVYSGSPEGVTATTAPSGLNVTYSYTGQSVTYGPSSTPPTDAGSYTVVVTIDDPDYSGTDTETLTISQAVATFSSSTGSTSFNGSPQGSTITTTVPPGLDIDFTYNGSSTPPTAVGVYSVVGTVNDPNYQGTVYETFTILPESSPWVSVASEATARTEETATLLPSGKVLVAGGFDASGSALATCEMYDPGSNSWTSAGSMVTARARHSATLLPNGTVLVVGGSGTTGFEIGDAEVYDPEAGTWSLAGTLTTARYAHTATLLLTGKVLVVGGTDHAGDFLADAELYDPGVGSWTATGPLSIGRYMATATLAANGKVAIIGGQSANGTEASVEEYDSAGSQVSSTGNLVTARSGHTATALDSGYVLVVGGDDGSYGSTSELYNPYSGTSFLTNGSLNVPRYRHNASLLPSGRVVVEGGLGVSGISTNVTEVYDELVDQWTEMGNTSRRRAPTTPPSFCRVAGCS